MDNPYIGRIVVLLSPIFIGIAGWLASWIADNLPGGPELDERELAATITGAFIAVAALVYKWLDNRGDYEVEQQRIDVGK